MSKPMPLHTCAHTNTHARRRRNGERMKQAQVATDECIPSILFFFASSSSSFFLPIFNFAIRTVYFYFPIRDVIPSFSVDFFRFFCYVCLPYSSIWLCCISNFCMFYNLGLLDVGGSSAVSFRFFFLLFCCDFFPCLTAALFAYRRRCRHRRTTLTHRIDGLPTWNNMEICVNT